MTRPLKLLTRAKGSGRELEDRKQNTATCQQMESERGGMGQKREVWALAADE